MDKNGKISGAMESKDTKNGAFRLEIQDGEVSGGTFIHQGVGHQTEVSIGPDGWKAGISGGKGNSKWSLGVENGKAEAKVLGGIKMKF